MNYLLQIQFVFTKWCYYNIITVCHHAVAPGDYDAISNLQLAFNTGDTEQCYNVTINQDNICENNPNEDFTVTLQYESGIQPISVAPDVADVIIDDDNEPECGEFYWICS